LLDCGGAGRLGTLWRASDLRSGQVVALKLLNEASRANPELLARVRQAVAAARQLQHPGIVPVREFSSAIAYYYIVSDYTPLPHLQQLDLGQPITVEQAVRVATTAADSLAYAHGLGVGHANLKPSNILLPRSGSVLLTDFGLAAPIRSLQPDPLLDISKLYGNAAYLAPELVRGEPFTPSADIYALGLILYEMLAGQAAFRGDVGSIVQQQLLHQPLPLARLRPQLPAELVAIVAQATAKEASGRYQSMTEFAAALRGFFIPWYSAAATQRARRSAPPTTQLNKVPLSQHPPPPKRAEPRVVVPRPANYVKGPALPTRALKASDLRRRPMLLVSLALLLVVLVGLLLVGVPHLG